MKALSQKSLDLGHVDIIYLRECQVDVGLCFTILWQTLTTLLSSYGPVNVWVPNAPLVHARFTVSGNLLVF